MKVFISQPMKDKNNEFIEKERNAAIEQLKKCYGDDIEIIDSFFKDAPHDANPLWFLGEAVKLIDEADIVCLCTGWESARGCLIEKECGIKYGKKVISFNGVYLEMVSPDTLPTGRPDVLYRLRNKFAQELAAIMEEFENAFHNVKVGIDRNFSMELIEKQIAANLDDIVKGIGNMTDLMELIKKIEKHVWGD